MNSHFLHPDDLLDEDRGAALGWKTLKQSWEAYLEWLNTAAPDIRNLTGSQMAGAVERYSSVSLRKTDTPDELYLTVDGLFDEAYLFMRVNEGQVGVAKGADIGCIMYGLFLSVVGIPFLYQVLNLVLFAELVVVWMAMNYLTAIKDYRGILISFAAAVLTAFLSGWLFCLAGGASVKALLAGVCYGYGIMMISEIILLYRHFPQGHTGQFDFLRWFYEYRPLAWIGLFTNTGLFAHLVIIWFGPIGKQVQGAFYGAPEHDVSALLAFLTILITTINFVASVEVNFYPRYRKFYDLFNGKGSLKEICQAQDEMLEVLENELAYTARKQLYTTALMLSVGILLLERLPLGFNDLMEGYFRILCVGYGIYAIGNTVMLMLLYFTDYRGALMATTGFMLAGVGGTCLLLGGPVVYYGFGFTLGSGVFCLIALIRLNWFTQNLPYHILSTQPIVAEVSYGIFSKLADYLARREGHRYET